MKLGFFCPDCRKPVRPHKKGENGKVAFFAHRSKRDAENCRKAKELIPSRKRAAKAKRVEAPNAVQIQTPPVA